MEAATDRNWGQTITTTLCSDLIHTEQHVSALARSHHRALRRHLYVSIFIMLG